MSAEPNPLYVVDQQLGQATTETRRAFECWRGTVTGWADWDVREARWDEASRHIANAIALLREAAERLPEARRYALLPVWERDGWRAEREAQTPAGDDTREATT